MPGASPAAQLGVLLLLFGLLLAARALIILRRDVLLARLQLDFVDGHRRQIIRAVADTRWDVLARLRHARITHVLGSDVQACGDAATMTLHGAVSLTTIAGQVALIAFLAPVLAIAILALLALGMWALRPWLARSRQLGSALTDANLALVGGTTQFLGGLKLAFSQNLQRGFVSEFETVIGQAGERRVAFTRQRTLANLALTGFAALIAGLTILIGIALLDAAAPALIAFLFVIARMNGPVTQLQNAAQLIAHSLPAYRKIRELEDELARARREAAPAINPAEMKLAGRIDFRDVTYLHGSEAGGGVRELDIAIEPGEFVGLTGASGAGKTTFADLLVGLYPPQEGTVLIDGQPLEGARLAAWRDAVSYVSQDPYLFHDSVRRNLLWARPEVTEDELWAALESAEAAGLVRGLAAGLETIVGERGSLLSGGERQRIALARALLRRPRLLLLDEATNAIDVAGERILLQRLRNAHPGITILMIAHREQSLAFCDRIVELREGHRARDERR
jgi:ATP-binding cassette subfamily C protein